jgi:predicted nucleic acid-binding protein
MAYLVDTDILVDLTRNNLRAIEYIDGLEDDWSISSITALELIVGAKNNREVNEIDRLLAAYGIRHITSNIEQRAYRILHTYAKSNGLRTLDSLIAATAVEDGLILATRNRKHFAMIEGLSLDVPQY